MEYKEKPTAYQPTPLPCFFCKHKGSCNHFLKPILGWKCYEQTNIELNLRGRRF